MRREVAGVDAVPRGGGADEAGAGVDVGQIRAALVAGAVVGRRREAVGAAARDRVDARAGKTALGDVVRRDADLHLFDRFERDRRDPGAVADAARRDAEAERVVEVGAVDGHVVGAVVLPGERAVAAVLRRQARDVGDTARNGWQRREVLAHHGGRGAGATRAEHRIALTDDRDRFGDVRDLPGELQVLRPAELQGEGGLFFAGEP